MKPAVRDDRDVVVWRDGLEHRNSQGDVVLVLGISLPQNKAVVEENNFAVNIFHKDDKCLCATVSLLVPPEVRDDRKINAKQRACNGLDLCLQPKKKRRLVYVHATNTMLD